MKSLLLAILAITFNATAEMESPEIDRLLKEANQAAAKGEEELNNPACKDLLKTKSANLWDCGGDAKAHFLEEAKLRMRANALRNANNIRPKTGKFGLDAYADSMAQWRWNRREAELKIAALSERCPTGCEAEKAALVETMQIYPNYNAYLEAGGARIAQGEKFADEKTETNESKSALKFPNVTASAQAGSSKIYKQLGTNNMSGDNNCRSEIVGGNAEGCKNIAEAFFTQEASARIKEFADEKNLPHPEMRSTEIQNVIAGMVAARLESEEKYAHYYQKAIATPKCRNENSEVCKKLRADYLEAYNAARTRVEDQFNAWKKDYLEEGAKAEQLNAKSLDELKDKIITQEAKLDYEPWDKNSKSARYRNGACDFKVAGLVDHDQYAAVYNPKSNLKWKVGPFTPISKANDKNVDLALKTCQTFAPAEAETCSTIVKSQGSFLGSGYVLLRSEDSKKAIAVSSKAGEQGILDCLAENGFSTKVNQVASEARATGKPGKFAPLSAEETARGESAKR